MNRYYKCMFFLSLHTWRVRLTLIHSSGGRWVFRGDRVSSAAVSLGDAPLMQSGICKWHLWCDSHWQTGLKYVWPEDILLEISATKWQRVIWEFWCCVFGQIQHDYVMLMTEANAGKLFLGFPCPWPNHSLQKHTCMERDKERGGQREPEWKRGLYRVTILDTFQGFCQSLWRFGKKPLQLNSSVVTMAERYPVEAPFPEMNAHP